MTPYIVNLTTQLIMSNQLAFVWIGMDRTTDPQRFVHTVAHQLELGDVSRMNPETLGKIMCSFETQDLPAEPQVLADCILFTGSTKRKLCVLVSTCLAYAIFARLQGGSVDKNIPGYTRTGG